jgi:hypothetical protein
MYKGMKLTEMVKGKRVTLEYYCSEELWYITDDGFQFPVPIEDAGTAKFLASDKATLFMRYIRKHLAKVDELVQEEKLNEDNY